MSDNTKPASDENPDAVTLATGNYLIELTDEAGVVQKMMAAGTAVRITPLKKGGMVLSVQ